jgi:hypothetical protein
VVQRIHGERPANRRRVVEANRAFASTSPFARGGHLIRPHPSYPSWLEKRTRGCSRYRDISPGLTRSGGTRRVTGEAYPTPAPANLGHGVRPKESDMPCGGGAERGSWSVPSGNPPPPPDTTAHKRRRRADDPIRVQGNRSSCGSFEISAGKAGARAGIISLSGGLSRILRDGDGKQCALRTFRSDASLGASSGGHGNCACSRPR